MNRKRILAALLAGMMVSLTACGVTARDTASKDVASDDASDEKEAENPETESEDVDPDAETEPEEAAPDVEADTAEEESGTEDREADTDDGEESEEESSGRYEKGNVTDTAFESKWIGFRYELPEEFTMSSQEEMDAVLQLGSEIIYEDNADMIVDYSKMVMVYEMMAMDRLNNTVSVFVERTSMEPEEYAEAIERQMGLVEGVEIDRIDEEKDAEVGGVKFHKFSFKLDYSGAVMYQDYYMAERNGRMIEILLSYHEESVRDVMLSGFAPY
ncbi:MAG: hypothetical protein HFI48_12415 [Lachnospiraceae bacterium]|nr:hypothetical protein [Lachnospiraceae bacterium]